MPEYSVAQRKLWARQEAINAALTPVNGELPEIIFYQLQDGNWHHSLANSVAGLTALEQPDHELINLQHLAGRTAQCTYCKTTVPSSPNLAFFNFQGEDSQRATQICKCGYGLPAHVKTDPVTCTVGGFTPRGPEAHDNYYCGCRGWD